MESKQVVESIRTVIDFIHPLEAAAPDPAPAAQYVALRILPRLAVGQVAPRVHPWGQKRGPQTLLPSPPALTSLCALRRMPHGERDEPGPQGPGSDGSYESPLPRGTLGA